MVGLTQGQQVTHGAWSGVPGRESPSQHEPCFLVTSVLPTAEDPDPALEMGEDGTPNPLPWSAVEQC